jgi:hypothetical protein
VSEKAGVKPTEFLSRDDTSDVQRDYLTRLHAMRERTGWESQNDKLEVERLLRDLEADDD